MRLNTIYDNKGSRHKFKRVGRGLGSGKGKTCGRGQKGQTSRSGVSINGFEGGQMAIHFRLPKRGFSNKPFQTDVFTLTIKKVNEHLATNVITSEVNKEVLLNLGWVKSTKTKIKLIGNEPLNKSVNFEIDLCSNAAKEIVAKAGGQLKLLNSGE